MANDLEIQRITCTRQETHHEKDLIQTCSTFFRAGPFTMRRCASARLVALELLCQDALRTSAACHPCTARWHAKPEFAPFRGGMKMFSHFPKRRAHLRQFRGQTKQPWKWAPEVHSGSSHSDDICSESESVESPAESSASELSLPPLEAS